tara:strand:- start:55 stop:408 length:354 start_codon:yes stop_codon:yes gene_type:complete
MENSEKLALKKVISLIKSSENKYKSKDFRGAWEDKLEIKYILNNKIFSNNEIMDIYKKELSKLYNSKFDLIKDHKMKINKIKRQKIIDLLENKSHEKFLKGDYEGAIKALRRSEKYH